MLDSYQSLTPEMQLDALASIGIYPLTGLIALNSYENRVYLFTDETEQRYVVKFYRPARWSDSQLQEEHDFCFKLKQSNVDISAPVIVEGQSLFHFAGFAFALFESLSARTMETDNIDFLYDVGVTIGKLHRASSKIVFSQRNQLDVNTMISTPLIEFKKSKNVPKFIKEDLFKAIDDVTLKIETIFAGQCINNIALHGDAHPSNILNLGDIPYLVDFDDCKTGPAVQDLWMFLSGTEQDQRLQLSMLLDGYQEEFEFDLKELVLIDALRSLRIINYVIWIDLRWSDPAFKSAFPWFTTDQYWKDLLQSLQQQIIKMNAPALSIYPGFNA